MSHDAWAGVLFGIAAAFLIVGVPFLSQHPLGRKMAVAIALGLIGVAIWQSRIPEESSEARAVQIEAPREGVTVFLKTGVRLHYSGLNPRTEDLWIVIRRAGEYYPIARCPTSDGPALPTVPINRRGQGTFGDEFTIGSTGTRSGAIFAINAIVLSKETSSRLAPRLISGRFCRPNVGWKGLAEAEWPAEDVLLNDAVTVRRG